MSRVSVVIADRHPVVLYGLTNLLSIEHNFNVVASCRDGAQCLQAIRELCPNVALVDFTMPGLSGLEILDALRAEHLPTRVVLMAASVEDRELIVAVANGAYGVVLKEVAPEILVDCIHQVAAGQRLLPLLHINGGSQPDTTAENALTALTDRELQIAQLVAKGLSNKEVGRQLNLSDGTIKVHLHRIYQKLAINNRTALAVWASQLQRG